MLFSKHFKANFDFLYSHYNIFSGKLGVHFPHEYRASYGVFGDSAGTGFAKTGGPNIKCRLAVGQGGTSAPGSW